MKSELFEQHLLDVYQEAIRFRKWAVAEHLLCAIEACAPAEAPISASVASAYSVLAAEAQKPRRCGTRSKRD
ncbi:hypothetical protein ABL840_04365 [Variovorax sp. NFACC27]|jgi:hypothetical protein|uniref:Uncharacterized protein n=1 Tax=Variovorax paradoxus TaxID=34073 RepID=A0A5Q0LX88_VARPD|nr:MULTISPECIES: hypothetical protein [Variovorax]MDZ4359089.1 hypothetical protein [Variovorax sp.]SEF19215.1 hypothetical protein SAMN03159371_00018 [Variovorax sp. NFACC28]SEF76056.1 hypothetical protein SAMN03159365_00799 [Variovorax sp. NFACC29]SFB79401.1 hypothetical protein SAMN03159379_00798 [Variovorax sp. NFACC26]SFG78382.1 hypothetical protein SAMN03159447_04921 [Variovorax sp. NFACC27]